ncbi:reverse transcriptase [Tanacetum coccineum]
MTRNKNERVEVQNKQLDYRSRKRCENVNCYTKSQGKTVILVVVDRLSKYAHFMALSHPYTASSVAQVFLDTVYRLHGLPNSIIIDRDSAFLSLFWQSLFKLLKVELKMSTAYHPQTDGQTEVVNKCVECYLRCMTGERPKEWVQWLPLAEFWYNTNKHSSINVTSYEVVYGQTPPLHNPYLAGESAVESVDRSLQAREAAIEMIKFHITRAQDRMKRYANLKRSEREFDVGMWVYLKLHPHRQVKGNLMLEYGLLAVKPEAILDRRMAKLNNRVAVHVLVKWVDHSEEDATWELYEDLVIRFPKFPIDP